ncbi:tRNA uracil 4-sulfurtransferase ThiI [Shuttleworthella satelles]|uniref:Probable tRNA sulfurtransferase n=1 Tax=Shuttleworthella satelles DSM 14600 TaxID=626523 RepID=C4G936_9FIRM|nr:tRNA uracil 4-sulfurtransferase ThiI [Shuttleworthia satelles]EEP29133.1 thiamine biosynthesis/tRNA modification protein ThiI [Shuttleworthia satelles DSM 14600]
MVQYKAFLIKYGEIAIKGKNRHVFEEALERQIKRNLRDCEGEFAVERQTGRIFIRCLSDYDYDELVGALTRIFGIIWICPCVLTEIKSFDETAGEIVRYIGEAFPDRHVSFKVKARRPNKKYPIHTMDLNAMIGEKILDAYPEMTVDVHHPDFELNVEIREQINFYARMIPGPGGMPVGTNGKAMLLLSGGIDSPVAGWMIAKRGVTLDATYFHAPPYTSERAKQKVIDLAEQVARYAGPIRLHIVNFTDIQLYIYEQCPHDELTIIMRRYMMRIAEHFARENACMGLITGESIGQVASQTMQSLLCTNAVCQLPVYRPLIGFDKQDIVSIAEKIDTYETSILPYEDCCTIFVARHPVTKPRLEIIERSELKLAERIEDLYRQAIETTETIICDGSPSLRQ